MNELLIALHTYISSCHVTKFHGIPNVISIVDLSYHPDTRTPGETKLDDAKDEIKCENATDKMLDALKAFNEVRKKSK